MTLGFLLHSGGVWDELLVIGVVIYLLSMFVMAEVKKRRQRKARLQRRAERAQSQLTTNPSTAEPKNEE